MRVSGQGVHNLSDTTIFDYRQFLTLVEDQMITIERLKDVLGYCEVTGNFYWRKKLSKKTVVGAFAGTSDLKGYRNIRIDGVIYRAHRLAWLYVYGEMPNGEVDHINGVKFDNKISNLRVTTRGENAQNQTRPSRRSTTGYLGVSVTKNKSNPFRAEIRINRVGRYLGVYETAKEAHEAYLMAKKDLHPFGVVNG
jgi:hypothetical protein